MKSISIYVQGGEQSAVTYYRFMQYFDNMKCIIKYRYMFSPYLYRRFMPIGDRGIILKVLLYLYSLVRVICQLFCDMISSPQYIVISRTLIKKNIPVIYKCILNVILIRGTILIWDFDDDILELKEICGRDFDYLLRKSSKIVIASPYLQEIIPSEYREKCVFIPTTDGAMSELVIHKVLTDREHTYIKEVRLLWVGTSSSLQYLETICPLLDGAAEFANKNGKDMILTVVCNAPLMVQTTFLKVNNLKWTREVANEQFLCSHIGLMPLDDSLMTRRKGGFKLIQYLSVGLPVVVSSVGINSDILKETVGYGIRSLNSLEWKNSIINLSLDIDFWKKCSLRSKEIYDRDFSLSENYSKWEAVLSN